MINMSCSRVMFEMKFGKPEDDAPQFVLKECEQYQEGTFSIQMSFFEARCIAISKVSVTYISISNEIDKDFSLKL